MSSHALETNDVTPISRLHDDLLALIFSTNTEPEISLKGTIKAPYCSPLAGLPGLLTNARFMSQVCERWRNLILGLPLLWGRLLSLLELREGNNLWRDEILKRTKNAPLWIYGTIPGQDNWDPNAASDMRRFFLSLLDIHWNRIQMLDLCIMGKNFENFAWSPLLRPAPNLKCFKIIASSIYDSYEAENHPAESMTLFDGLAPSLTVFNFAFIALQFKIPSALYKNLRVMVFSCKWSISRILNTLVETPRVETLSISVSPKHSVLIGEKNIIQPHIVLPRLKHLSLDSDLWACLTILEHITPCLGCSLKLSSINTEVFYDENHVLKAQQQLSRYFHNFARLHTKLENISILCYRNSFHSKIDPEGIINDPSFDIAFSIDILCPDSALPRLLSIYASNSYYASVTHLTLNLRPEVLSHLTPNHPSPLSFLVGVDILEIVDFGEHILIFLMDLPSSIFPNLKLLFFASRLRSYQDSDEKDLHRTAILLEKFLWKRKERGLSVPVIMMGPQIDSSIVLYIKNFVGPEFM